ncbi:hypothetical protein L4D04_11985 [Photobacterium angustum]|uniref:Uncharacterized protein n=1 Tax=Photobacterium angustum (strain S14 / CCUG 15956) TaxID=314292 RepID=Q1ZW94_PHOAS|nr:hypothetical protein [Photobacterium angustum]EAS65816.1 hypothetical protein VAS14_10904 [Photobacterium angustum S14]
MFHLKKVIFSVLFHFYQFFRLSFPLWLMISSLGVSLGLILLLSGENHFQQGISATTSFSLIAVYLIMLKHFYSKLLNWSDTRSSKEIIVSLKQ